MKRRLTALLAVFLAALSVVPLGASAVVKPHTDITATCTLPDLTISVSVPANAQALVNPYRLQVTMDGKISDAQILCEPMYLDNQSEVPVSVSASVTGVINEGSDMEFYYKTTRKLKDKSAFVYFELQAVADPDDVTWGTSYNSRKNIVVSEDTEELEDIVTLGAATQDNHYGAFRLTGDCVANPTDDPWTEEDGFTAEIVFTFKAQRLS
jgi:hypothetical protein